jgi:threonine dehydratase
MSTQSTSGDSISPADLNAARDRISSLILHTPLVPSHAMSERAGVAVHLKLECFQRTGSFKVRGALSKVSSLTPEQRQAGLICASSGNHGLGVAYASGCFQTRCVVVLPEDVNPHKFALLQKLGAELIKFGITSDVRQEKVEELSRKHGYTQVHPFSDPVLIAGQATVGLEVLEDLPDVGEVYVPIGGGGLISGIALAIKTQRPGTRIYGVEPVHSNAMSEALRHRRPVVLPEVRTMADGLAAATTEDLNYSIVQQHVDDVLLVSEDAIRDAMLFLLEKANVLVEPSGAASLAGLFMNTTRIGPSVAILSGGNITLQQLDKHRGLDPSQDTSIGQARSRPT